MKNNRKSHFGLGFRLVYKIWQILKRFAGTFHLAQSLKLGGVSVESFTQSNPIRWCWKLILPSHEELWASVLKFFWPYSFFFTCTVKFNSSTTSKLLKFIDQLNDVLKLVLLSPGHYTYLTWMKHKRQTPPSLCSKSWIPRGFQRISLVWACTGWMY